MRTLQPKSLIHRGRIQASGYHFSTELLGTAEARRRVLTRWCPQCRVYRVGRGYVLLLPEPESIHTHEAPGSPLVEMRGPLGTVWSAAPLSPRELKALQPPAHAVVLVTQGQSLVVRLLETAREDPATWLTLPGFQLLAVETLGAELPPPASLFEPAIFDPRSSIPGIPEADPQAQDVVAVLEGRAPSAGRMDAAKSFFGRLFARLRGRKAANPVPAHQSSDTAAASTTEDDRLPPPLHQIVWVVAWLSIAFHYALKMASLGRIKPLGQDLERLESMGESIGNGWSRWNALRERLKLAVLLHTPLGPWIHRKQAAYLRRMLELFERGEMEMALRYAIPLGKGDDCGMDSLAMDTPTARANLQILTRAMGGGSSILAGDDDLYEHLQSVYRQTFERLVRQEQIDQAAFILVELLKEVEEAVAFLEQHGRLQLAAELAEGRELEPGLVVRQWFIAGNRERAVLLARQLGAFADAISSLERSHPQEAADLRRAWAENRAAAGDYAVAVEACWPVPELRPAALGWMERCIRNGGVAGARMLARKLVLTPEDTSETLTAVRTLLDDDHLEGVYQRLEFARTLTAGERTEATSAAARAAVRAIGRDLGEHPVLMPQAEFRRLVEFSGDAALRADTNRLCVPIPSPATKDLPVEFRLDSDDAGAVPVLDAVRLSNGQVLVALGEMGARLLAADGRVLHHFHEPAHWLVLSEQDTRAIAIAPRGEVKRLARLNLETRHAEPWCEARFHCWARTFDGGQWLVSAASELLLIDTLRDDFKALWRDASDTSCIHAIELDRSRCRVLRVKTELVAGPNQTVQPQTTRETWIYHLPAFRLRYRYPVNEFEHALVDSVYTLQTITADGTVVRVQPEEPEKTNAPASLALFLRDYCFLTLPPNLIPTPPLEAEESRAWLSIAIRGREEAYYYLISRDEWELALRVHALGAFHISARISDQHLTLADDRGRVLIFDLQRRLPERVIRVV